MHCVMGISRSSTCVIAFLMIKRGMSAAVALRQVRELRGVVPNDGFLRQLAVLDITLRERRSLDSSDETVPIPKPKKACGLS